MRRRCCRPCPRHRHPSPASPLAHHHRAGLASRSIAPLMPPPSPALPPPSPRRRRRRRRGRYRPTMPTTRWTTSCARWSRRVPGECCSAAACARADLQRRSRRPRRPCRSCRPSLAIAPLSIGSLAEAALHRCRRRAWGWAGGWKGGRMHVMVRISRPARATRPIAAGSPPVSRRRHALRWLARHVPRGAAGEKNRRGADPVHHHASSCGTNAYAYVLPTTMIELARRYLACSFSNHIFRL